MDTALSNKELAETQELFPDLSEEELMRLITALDISIDKVLDNYFRLNEQ